MSQNYMSEQELQAALKQAVPLNDRVFSNVFGVQGKSENILKSLVNTILEDSGETLIDKIDSITLQSSVKGMGIKSYAGRMDIVISTEHANIDVEPQRYKDRYIIDRALFYTSELVLTSLQPGEKFNDMLKSVCIVISEQKVFDDGIPFHSVHEISERVSKIRSTDRLQIHIVDLYKFKKLELQKNNALHQWLSVLINPQSDFISEVSKMNMDINEYRDIYNKVTSDPSILRQINRDLLADIEHNSMIDDAETRGRAEGKAEERREFAKKLLSDSVPIATISKYTGLSIDEIEKLK